MRVMDVGQSLRARLMVSRNFGPSEEREDATSADELNF